MKSFSVVLSVAAACASLADGILLTGRDDEADQQQLVTTLADSITANLEQQAAENETTVEEDPPEESQPAAEQEQVNAGDEPESTPLAATPVSNDTSDTTDISEGGLTPIAQPAGFDPASEELTTITTSTDSDEEQGDDGGDGDDSDPCDALRNWTSDELAGPPGFNYDEESEILFEMQDLTPGCEVKYECQEVFRVDGNPDYQALNCVSDFYQDGNSVYFLANQEDYRNGRFAPGEYEVTLKGTAKSDETKQHEVSVKFELLDICDPPAILS